MGLQHNLSKRWRSYRACTRLHTLCGAIFSFFKAQWMLLRGLYLKHVCHMAHGQLHWLHQLYRKRGQCPSYCDTRGINVGKFPWNNHLERPTSHRGLMLTTEADLALYHLCKVLFHPVSDCVLFSLLAPIPRSHGQKHLESNPGIDKLVQSTLLLWDY